MQLLLFGQLILSPRDKFRRSGAVFVTAFDDEVALIVQITGGFVSFGSARVRLHFKFAACNFEVGA